jgi:hypothetical protein
MRLCAIGCSIVLLLPAVAATQGQPVSPPPAAREQLGAQAEAKALGTLRAIISAQAVFKTTCGHDSYAPGLVDLGKAPVGTKDGYLAADLAAANSVTKNGYTFTIGSSEMAVPGSKASCNGIPSGQLVPGYYATATPVAEVARAGGRYLGTNTSAKVFVANGPLTITNRSSDGTEVK